MSQWQTSTSRQNPYLVAIIVAMSQMEEWAGFCHFIVSGDIYSAETVLSLSACHLVLKITIYRHIN